MAARDIMQWSSPHGGHPRVQRFRMNLGEDFLRGEPVSVNADGELTESANNPADADLMGIAMEPHAAGAINPATGAAHTTGDLITVAIPD